MRLERTLGAIYLGEGRCSFRVWAPLAQAVQVHLDAPQERLVPLQRDDAGYYHGILTAVEPGSLYRYCLDKTHSYADPASRSQPHDVQGPSQVIDPQFPWEDQHWHGLPLREYVLYELHVGTFTEAGTFEAVIAHLAALKDLGITAIELMPIAQFPGSRNWGYDGVYPFAAQASYGGVTGLKRLVNACHQHGLAVVLDVVYNHLGPEGNHLRSFGPYFNDHYRTPWGAAINFDGPHSDEVRRYFLENALYWISDCHIDALRLDAVHAIIDHSAYPFLQELAATVHAQAERLHRYVYTIAESDLDDPRLLHPPALGGYGLDAQWSDSFHHALHALLTGEREGYYVDFGQVAHLAKAWSEGFVYSGQYSSFRQRRHGASSRMLAAHRLVVCNQNHDQIGNRMLGERFAALLSFEALKLAAGVTLLAPFVPLLFMGEEYGETAPFLYFISHSDADLVAAVRQGRREEFAAFPWLGEAPDPQDEATFRRCRLQHNWRDESQRGVLRAFYQQLLLCRKTLPPLAHLEKDTMEIQSLEQPPLLGVRRWAETQEVLLFFHFGDTPAAIGMAIPDGRWSKQLDSAESHWGGPGSLVPAIITGSAEVNLTLPARAVLLFMREADTA